MDLFEPNDLKRVSVQLPMALDQTYDYLVPEDLQIEPGDYVLVPLGPQQKIGVVWDEVSGDDYDRSKLKTIIRSFDLPPLPEVSRKFIRWVAKYNLMPAGMVLRMVMSASKAFEAAKPRFGVKLAGPLPAKITPAREKALKFLQNQEIWSKAQLAKQAGVSVAVIDGLVKAGTLVSVQIEDARLPQPNAYYRVPEFSDSQQNAIDTLRSAVEANTYSVSLLDGVTGSGKTEVYFEAVAEALAAKRQVLIMLPEIALTNQFIERFEGRFGCRPVEWHSTLSDGARSRIWKAIASGEAKAVIAARSGLFLPFSNLGLIVVDEEHDAAFKQEDRVIYQGRDMAVVRSSLGKIPVILASATPSVESYVNVKHAKYRHVQLKERFSGYELPDIEAIDLKQEPPEKGHWLSPVLIKAMADKMAVGQQSLLFLNRRGYAPLTLCRACGYRFDCPQCSAWLVDHRYRNRLQCHHCGFSTPTPKKCPKCDAENSLVPCGPGVERVAEDVKHFFPEARVTLLSSDLAPNINALRDTIQKIADGEVDIVIGTQIVAKGHNFPKLTLVGVIDGDLGLGGADPRASERTFQLIQQVIGRAGRYSADGVGYIQTHMPEHPVMNALISGDKENFIEREIQSRHSAGWPPFGRLASLVISAKMKELAHEFARQLALRAPKAPNIAVLGPAEAPIAVIRGRHRYRILVKTAKETDLQNYLKTWLNNIQKPKGDLRMSVDIDPYNFL